MFVTCIHRAPDAGTGQVINATMCPEVRAQAAVR
jgi:hypothetical protein